MDINGRQMRIVHLNGQTVGDGPTVHAAGLSIASPLHENAPTGTAAEMGLGQAKARDRAITSSVPTMPMPWSMARASSL